MLVRKLVLFSLLLTVTGLVYSHGDVTPQAVDVSTLPKLGDTMLDKNPFAGNKEAIRVGASAYNQNCARCHGLEVISGGIAPDLRKLNMDCEGLANPKKKAQCIADMDVYFRNSVLGGKVVDGRVYMPSFAAVFSQEAIWAIRSYIETRKYDE
ncbi:MAG TPA: cytochrome c-550 PedF [Limnobacter sp.]|uniref:cytochrome c-550 PedF n=1 Tax=Limnobacter sp. TaxID=2003368 RepID=UPI002E341376|nr:cytochrome c-550 PedF [Limnobacter sp.]HEX5486012.1 cytochrome c-550 PedF [Limnobacter sp.]